MLDPRGPPRRPLPKDAMTANTPAPSKRAAIVVNPTKVASEDFKADFHALCEAEGWAEPLWLETTAEDPGVGQAREALEAGVDVVIAAGGDGTVRCVADVLSGTGTPMGLVPLGTGNLLARNLDIDITDPMAASRGVLTGTDRKVDVVSATLDRSGDAKRFLVMAGLGFDAAIMANTNDELKDRVGWLAYVDAGIRNLPGKPVKATVRMDGQPPVRRRIRSVMVGNCGKIMGGVEIFPDAKIDDGILDVVIMSPAGRFGWVAVLAGVFNRNRKNSSVEYFAGKSAELSLDHAQEFQLDGDSLGKAKHLKVTVEPEALTVRLTATS